MSAARMQCRHYPYRALMTLRGQDQWRVVVASGMLTTRDMPSSCIRLVPAPDLQGWADTLDLADHPDNLTLHYFTES